MMFMFHMCPRSWAALTPDQNEMDFKKEASVLMILQKLEE